MKPSHLLVGAIVALGVGCTDSARTPPTATKGEPNLLMASPATSDAIAPDVDRSALDHALSFVPARVAAKVRRLFLADAGARAVTGGGSAAFTSAIAKVRRTAESPKVRASPLRDLWTKPVTLIADGRTGNSSAHVHLNGPDSIFLARDQRTPEYLSEAMRAVVTLRDRATNNTSLIADIRAADSGLPDQYRAYLSKELDALSQPNTRAAIGTEMVASVRLDPLRSR